MNWCIRLITHVNSPNNIRMIPWIGYQMRPAPYGLDMFTALYYSTNYKHIQHRTRDIITVSGNANKSVNNYICACSCLLTYIDSPDIS